MTGIAEPGCSGLRKTLNAGRFAVTAELTPPVATDPAGFLDAARPLRGVAHAVNVTDGPGGNSRLSSLAAAALLLREGIEPVLQLTCRDRNRLGLQADALGAAALGIRNILVLRGDDPSKGGQPETRPVFDLDSSTLLQTLSQMRDTSTMPDGRPITGPTDFFLGAADAPLDPPPGWKPTALAAKIDAGVAFLQTQFCMDMDVLHRYLARLADEGLAGRVHILVGIAPLVSAASARWIRSNLFGTVIPDSIVTRMEQAADPRTEGRRICAELLLRLSEIDGVAGAHIMAPMNQRAIPEVIAESGVLVAV